MDPASGHQDQRDPDVHHTAERGHGRTERRTLKITSVAAGLAFFRAAQAIRITRREVKGAWSAETCYAVTSLTVTQASLARLAAIIRGHWGIEDRLHWVRDTDFDEDRSQVRTASGPRIMASLRNLVITILRLAGTTSIAAALRYHARRPSRPLQAIMTVLPALPEPRAAAGPLACVLSCHRWVSPARSPRCGPGERGGRD